MKQICAWCGKRLYAADSEPTGPLSHGICQACVDFLEANDATRTLDAFLEGLPAPVLVMDDAGRVRTGNRRALALLGKPLDDIVGQLGGNAVECAHARLPGGCGGTDHCIACGIRNTVMTTHRTGSPQFGTVTHQEINSGHPQRTRFRITTAKQGAMVLLRIDSVGPLDGCPGADPGHAAEERDPASTNHRRR